MIACPLCETAPEVPRTPSLARAQCRCGALQLGGLLRRPDEWSFRRLTVRSGGALYLVYTVIDEAPPVPAPPGQPWVVQWTHTMRAEYRLVRSRDRARVVEAEVRRAVVEHVMSR